MRLTLGLDFFQARDKRHAPVVLDTDRLINGHLLIVGSSGTGKSYTIKRLIREAQKNGDAVRFHVFDVHGDLDIPGASVIQFSETSPYGLNPLRCSPDPHFGGVRKAIAGFIRTVNTASVTALGVKQEAVLRYLLEDVYRDYGFLQDDPSTWAVSPVERHLVGGITQNRLYLQVPMAEKDAAKGQGARWDPDRKLWWVHAHLYEGGIARWPPASKERTYPTVADVAEYAKRIYQERYLGSDQKAVRALGVLNRKSQALQRKQREALKLHRLDEMSAEDKTALEAAREAAIDAYADYVGNVQTGLEFETLMRYDSADVLKSVADRLGNLKATGIFKSATPAFDPKAPVWRYKLNALSMEEKKMLVLFTLQNLFYQAMQRGQADGVTEVVVLDELGTYTSSQDDENGDGVIGTVAREGRKFGLALWAANQSPANVPESLVASVGTKIILGIDEMYWASAVTRLRIETKLLEWIRAHHTLAVQMKERGALKNRWWWVQLEA